MNITYRRWAGSIALSDGEQGRRGIWWEKRRALLAYLKQLGHTVTLASKPSRFSKGLWTWPAAPPKHADLLMIEFGPCHWVWNHDDIAETAKLIQSHKGRIIFLCDDPEMLYGNLEPRALRLIAERNFSRWTLWLNTPWVPPSASERLKGCRVVDAPFAALIKPNPLSKPAKKAAVYMGRSSDERLALLTEIGSLLPLDIYGEPKHWESLPLAGAPPTQVERSAVYARYTASVCVTDVEHKQLGWRTGRAYHSLLAGTPTLVEADHEVLRETFHYFRSPAEAAEGFGVWSKSPEARKKAWTEQIKKNLGARHFEAAKESLTR